MVDMTMLRVATEFAERSLNKFWEHGAKSMTLEEIEAAQAALDKLIDYQERNDPDEENLEKLDADRDALEAAREKAKQARPRVLHPSDLKKEAPKVYQDLVFKVFQGGQLSDADLAKGQIIAQHGGYTAKFPHGIQYTWSHQHGWV